MVEFITIKQKEMKFGTNNFVEVANKKAVTSDGEKPFISITRGYYTEDKQKKFTKAISLPLEETLINEVIDAIGKVI
ncbi:MAG: hypothetical protein K0B02_02705 [DPANN group archaeon]|nr:hypothetical protein [DPANN group archaeon]